MFRAAIIGVNGWAANYLPHLTRLTEAGKLEFAAAVVRNPAKNPEVTEKLRAQGSKFIRHRGKCMRGSAPIWCASRPGLNSTNP